MHCAIHGFRCALAPRPKRMQIWFGHCLLVTLLVLVSSPEVKAQWCCVDTLIEIADRSTVTLRLQISGTANNNLADTSQGLCGVRLRFSHDFIGDLTMELISPAGQRVRLMGPTGNSGLTSFSKWSIGFVSCADTALPDPGFREQWNNLQRWGIFGRFYSGTYHPFIGCLEDFNLGTVDGTWTLSITDNEIFYKGQIEGFCLLFCDQSGINCTDCSPNGGIFQIEGKSFCLGSADLNLTDRVQFSVYTPDTALYDYKYLLTQADTLLQILSSPNLTGLDTGSYLLCGISYLKSDSARLPRLGENLSSFRSGMVSGSINLCAELSRNCMQIDVYPEFSGHVEKILLCPSDSIVINGVSFTQSGQYPLDLKSIHFCDSSAVLDLEMVDIEIRSNVPDTIDCSNPRSLIDISGSVLTSKSDIVWSTQNGQFADTSDPLRVLVDEAGTYHVIAMDGNCTDTASFVVIKNGNVPSIELHSDTLTCSNPTPMLLARTNASRPAFSWSDGTKPVGNDSLIAVNAAGIYYLTITDENGCTNYSSLEVIADTTRANLVLLGGALGCRVQELTLYYTSDRPGQVVHWRDGKDTLTIADTLRVTESGWFSLSFISANGCLSEDSLFIVTTASVPDYFVDLDVLNCFNRQGFVLRNRTNAVVDSVAFTGPGGFMSDSLNPLIAIPGLYTLRIVDTAGCILDTFFTVQADTLSPDFVLQTDTLNCRVDSVQLITQILGDSSSLQYVWSGAAGFTRNVQNPFVNAPGNYLLTVSSPNGCSHTDSIFVFRDLSKPDLDVTASGELNCAMPSIRLLGSSSDANSTFSWSGPGGMTSNDRDPVVNAEGWYYVGVIGGNGCVSIDSIYVRMDTTSPIAGIISEHLSCDKNSAQILLLEAISIDSVRWTGPNGFFSPIRDIEVSEGGQYRVVVRGINGCWDTAFAFVNYDTASPLIALFADTLNCARLQAGLHVVTNDSIVRFRWTTPAGDTIPIRDLQVAQPGNYRLLVVASNGCLAEDSVDVIDLSGRPVLTKTTDSLTCLEPLASIGFSGNEPGLTYDWRGPNMFSSKDSTISVLVPGWYVCQVTNANACSSIDSIFVADLTQVPRMRYSDTLFDCTELASPVLIAYPSGILTQFQWTDPSGMLTADTVVRINGSGMYIFSGTTAYGCKSLDTLFVRFDTTPVRIIQARVDTINCLRKVVFPILDLSDPGAKLRWTYPGGDTSLLPNPPISEGGFYMLSIRGTNGCSSDTILNVFVDTLRPPILAVGGRIDCVTDSIMLDVQSTENLLTVLWQGPGNLQFLQRRPWVRIPGTYFAVAQGFNQCLSLDTAIVTIDTLKPDLLIRGDSIPCSRDSARLLASTAAAGARIDWSGPGGFSSLVANPVVYDTGWYYVAVTGTNQCQSRDSTYLPYARELPLLQAAGGTLNCLTPIIRLGAICDTPTVRFLWSGPGVFDSIRLDPEVSQPGLYRIEVTAPNGCSRDTFVNIVIDTIHPNVRLSVLDSLACSQTDVRLYAEVGGGGLQLDWSTTNGQLLQDIGQNQYLVRGQGDYSVVVVDPTNGCRDSATVELLPYVPSWGPMSLAITDPSCHGYTDGSVAVIQVPGANQPLRYELNQATPQDKASFTDLGAGTYRVTVYDRFGCTLDTSMVLTDPPALFLDLGRDTTIRFGTSFQIRASTNVNAWQILTWEPAGEVSCQNCLDVLVSPRVPTTFRLTLVNERGCRITDEIHLALIDDPRLFVPNAFSPNGDQINDILEAHLGPEIQQIVLFQVFDRWGNLVYEEEALSSEQRVHLWDGTALGKKVDPGVYVYRFEAVLKSGRRLRGAGDITLIR